MAAYDQIFADFMKVIEGFGVTKVESVGQPFDFNFMEAIMTAPRCVQMPALCVLFAVRVLTVRFRCSHLPSTEYKADIVCIEYQVGALVFPLYAVHCPLT
jgi:hypothetical protein